MDEVWEFMYTTLERGQYVHCASLNVNGGL